MSEDSHSVSALAAPAASTQGGCPTPLAWQQVVESLRQEGVRHRVDANGHTVSAVSLGEGPPVYFLPGFLGDHELFALTAWLLREEFCCVLIDPPADTRVRRVKPETLLDEWSDDVLRLADELGHDRLRLYGTSFGGLLALQMMVKHPDRLQAVALHCTFAGLRLRPLERVLVWLAMRSGRTFGQFQSAMRIQQSNHRHWFPPFDATRWEFFADNVAATPVRDAALRARVAGAVDLGERLPQLRTPTLLIESEGDGRTARAAQETLLAGLPDVRVEKVDNSGRLLHITHPHRLVKLLRSFWDELP
jgi:pimeloyl-ACP methyl ester carboxylesterase